MMLILIVIFFVMRWRLRRRDKNNNDIGVACEKYLKYNVFVVFLLTCNILWLDLKSTPSTNNSDEPKPEAIYGQTSLVDEGAQAAAASSSNYGRVSVAQEAAVYGETSLNTE